MNILVTGGAGYIGSHIVKELLANGHRVMVFDNLSKGHREAVPSENLVVGDLKDRQAIGKAIELGGIEAVIHMAADSLVGESMSQPEKYFQNNVSNGLNLLSVMLEKGIKKIVFSSTAAVYGEPEEIPITEKASIIPTNIYGLTKVMFEQILSAYDSAYGLRSISLRYFNAAGADPETNVGEDHSPETHLVPIVLQAALGKTDTVEIMGTDYPTLDGTCIRDYIHVNDLAKAHILALEALVRGMESRVYNLGNGSGYSVREVINAASEVTGLSIPVREGQRRPGDPAVLVADAARISCELGWKADCPGIKEIVGTAWEWHRKHPEGYAQKSS